MIRPADRVRKFRKKNSRLESGRGRRCSKCRGSDRVRSDPQGFQVHSRVGLEPGRGRRCSKCRGSDRVGSGRIGPTRFSSKTGLGRSREVTRPIREKPRERKKNGLMKPLPLDEQPPGGLTPHTGNSTRCILSQMWP